MGQLIIIILPLINFIADLDSYFNYIDSDYGRIRYIKPLLKLSETPLLQNLPLVKVGSNIPQWK